MKKLETIQQEQQILDAYYQTFKITKDDGSSYFEERNQIKHLNLSSPLTKLIQDAGRYCTRFASDLFIDWRMILGYFEDETITDPKYFVIGIRETGVDHSTYFLHHMIEAMRPYQFHSGSIHCDLYYPESYLIRVSKEKDYGLFQMIHTKHELGALETCIHTTLKEKGEF